MARILLAEDDPTIARLIQQVLEDAGHEVTIASNGFIALDRINTGRYELLLTDLEMPRMDGGQLLRELARRRAYLPTIVVSARPDLTEDIRGLPVDGVVPKPFSIHDLKTAVSRVLGQAAA